MIDDVAITRLPLCYCNIRLQVIFYTQLFASDRNMVTHKSHSSSVEETRF